MIFTETPKELISFISRCQEKILNTFWFYDVGFYYKIETPYSDRAVIVLVISVGNLNLSTSITYFEIFNAVNSDYLIDAMVEKINFILSDSV